VGKQYLASGARLGTLHPLLGIRSKCDSFAHTFGHLGTSFIKEKRYLFRLGNFGLLFGRIKARHDAIQDKENKEKRNRTKRALQS